MEPFPKWVLVRQTGQFIDDRRVPAAVELRLMQLFQGGKPGFGEPLRLLAKLSEVEALVRGAPPQF